MKGIARLLRRKISIRFRALLALFVFSGVFGIASLPISAAAMPSFNPRYSVVGDSFSSGDGAPPYVDQNCRVSVNSSLGAYFETHVTDLEGPRIWACSGATTAAITEGQQLTSLRLDNEVNGPVQIVTLTIGGDDVNFGGVLSNCYYAVAAANFFIPANPLGFPDPFGAQQALRDQYATAGCVSQNGKVESDLATMPKKLKDTYVRVHNAAPNARVLVLAYPDLYPTDPTGRCNYLPSGSVKWIMQKEAKLNGIIQQATQAADSETHANGLLIYVSPPPDFKDHTACSAQPWINPVSASAVNSANSYLQGGGAFQFNFLKNNQDTWIHPNADGYSNWADWAYSRLPQS